MLHYTDEDLKKLPEDKKETDLAIYNYRYEEALGREDWFKLGGVVNEDENYILYKTSKLEGRYAILIEKPYVPLPEVAAFIPQNVWCFPNPASAIDKITFVYSTEKKVHMEIEIFDLQGRLVWKKDLGEKYGTNIREEWNLSNTQGNKVAAGLYIYRLTATYPDGKKTKITKKLAIIP
jgi:hypothetical protein